MCILNDHSSIHSAVGFATLGYVPIFIMSHSFFRQHIISAKNRVFISVQTGTAKECLLGGVDASFCYLYDCHVGVIVGNRVSVVVYE